MKIIKLTIPYPYKAWLSISNDPDNTTEEAWKELNKIIFEELNLNWANSIFPVSYNLNLKDQISLESHPFISSQPTDTIHTWGDFVHAGSQGFSRKEALHSLKLLKEADIQPKIWVDHSRFLGNLLHGSTSLGGKKFHLDASGVKYENFEYTADYIHELGIRYIWDGHITGIVGQNRKICLNDIKKTGIKKYLKGNIDNKLLQKVKIEDFEFYTFKRYGTWKSADILGLSKVMNDGFFNELIRKTGFSIVYTHLGKRNPLQVSKNHIPFETLESLKKVKSLIEQEEIIFTSVSKLLDYCVIQSNILIKDNFIYFRSDKIRFNKLTFNDLKGYKFSFRVSKNFDIKQIKVFVEDEYLVNENCKTELENGVLSLIWEQKY